ncbi:MAG: PA14 domain-containing protein [Pirellulaceae bacterium]
MLHQQISLAVVAFLFAIPAFGIDDDLPQPGLIGVYRDQHGRTAERHDVGLSFHWSADSPDERLGGGKFSAEWTGQLLIRASGEYRFASESIGSVVMQIDDQVVLDAQADPAKQSQSQWIASDKASLRAGMHDVAVRFEKRREQVAMHLFWSSDKFAWEPLNPANTLVDPYDIPENNFERGRSLVEAYRCSACHVHPALHAPLNAPSLARLNGNLQPQWLVQRLMEQSPHVADDQASSENNIRQTRMPHFAMDRDDAKAIAAFLYDQSKGHKPKSLGKVKPPKAKRGETIESDPIKRGEVLFASLGCLACHAINDLGSDDLLSGGRLDVAGDKRPEGFFARWLLDPAAINSLHRMPQFALTPNEASDLDDYLSAKQTKASDEQGDANSSRSNRSLEWMKDVAMIRRARSCSPNNVVHPVIN